MLQGQNSKKQASILIVDDEELMRDYLEETFKRLMLDVETFSEPFSALERLKGKFFDVMITDLKLPNIDGIEVLRRVKEFSPYTEVIIITAFGSVENAVAAMKQGAFDYINKPFRPEEIELLVDRILRSRNSNSPTSEVGETLQRQDEFNEIVGNSEAIRSVLNLVSRVADSDSTVLIQGESGTGKELIARALHNHSSRSGQRFVAVNCAALPENLLETELFGHEKGSFTGAYQRKSGLFLEADKGTIFLDEIGDMSPALQIKVLRVLQEMTFTPVGGLKEVKVDVRVIAATNRNLGELVRKNQFREDLFYRLNVIPVEVPPLRERKEDIPLLVNSFLEEFNQKLRKKIKGLDSDAERMLLNYDWPGNVRELENIIRRAATLCSGEEITPEDFLGQLSPTAGGYPYIRLPETGVDMGRILRELEKDLISQALKRAEGNKTVAARLLGLKRTTFLERHRRLEE